MGDTSKQNEEALRERARQRIELGLLPRERATRIWGGRGTGVTCSLCDKPILDTEPEMELEYDSPSVAGAVRFHLRCQSIWDLARQTSQWLSVDEQLPPLHVLVEARVSLGGTRALILNVMRVCDGETGPIVWLNATTNGQLPPAWRPVEWRPPQSSDAPMLPGSAPGLSAGMPRRA